MQRPKKFSIFCRKSCTFIRETNIEPRRDDLFTWEYTDENNLNARELVQTRDVYIDTRYEARVRLYNYVTYTRQGLPIPVKPKYKAFADPEIGKSIPILGWTLK